MVNTKISLIILFAVKNGEAPYSHKKTRLGADVAQIMNKLLHNSDLNGRSQGKPLETIQV